MGFRKLKNGDKFIADYNKYKTWAAKDTSERQALYDGLNVNKFTYEKQIIYVAPFNVAGLGMYIKAKAPATGQNRPTPDLLGLAAGYFLEAAPTGANMSIITNNQLFSPGKLAKLTLKLRATDATSKSPSRITGAKYYRHTVNSASMPFGKKAATDNFAAVIADIRNNAAYETFAKVKGNSISIKPEAT